LSIVLLVLPRVSSAKRGNTIVTVCQVLV